MSHPIRIELTREELDRLPPEVQAHFEYFALETFRRHDTEPKPRPKPEPLKLTGKIVENQIAAEERNFQQAYSGGVLDPSRIQEPKP